MTDIYDSERWRQKVGQVEATLTRIVLQYCIDGVPIYQRKEILSAKVLQAFIGNLPPWLRYKAEHMLMQMIIPDQYKAKECAKYYDFAAKFEMQDLFHNGIDGVRVIMFGTTLDTPGRREQLNMQTVQAFYPCPHCLHTWQPGLRLQVYGGYRCFLPVGSPWRQREFFFKGHVYMFRDVEQRQVPLQRTDQNVSVMASLGTPRRPCCGHKGHRLLRRWPGVDWANSFCDVMHDLKCFAEMTFKFLVGRGRNGMYNAWNRDGKHRDDCEAYGIFEEFWSGHPHVLPPWRLSKDAVKIMDSRVMSMWWPHFVDKLAKKHHSFWTHR